MLHLDHIAIRRGPRLLFSDASFQIHPGKKVGITGANGTGKSSLFALILGELSADAGDLHKPADWIIAHLAQEVPAIHQEAIEYVIDGDAPLRALEQSLAQAEQQGEGERIAHLHAEMDHIGGYQARSRAAQLMAGLGFTPCDTQRPLDSFSGGWRMRLNLARTLMCRSDLLLLDEPTNHLDLDAVIWLEDWLKAYRGTLLLISHDRDFLDSVCDQILHLEQNKATLYSGNYTAFERIRTERLANQQASFEKQQREVAHMRSFVERFRAKATKAKQAQSRLKALERMELIAPAHVDSPFAFSFKPPRKNPHPLLQLHDSAVSYGDKAIFSKANSILGPGDRVGLLGPNGAGKSTFIKLLAGELSTQTGERIEAKDLQLGYFAQHQLEQLHPQHTPVEHLQQLDPQIGEQDARDYLGGFGFIGDKALEKVEPFSGGEKSRLALALVVYQRPNLLLLDEPTNHLDLDMRQALATALQSFEGAMVIVSHDRHLLRTCCDQLWLVHDQRVDEFAEDLDSYPRWLAKQVAPRLDEKPSNTASRKDQKRLEAERRQKLSPLKKKITQAEALMKSLQVEVAALEQQLSDNDLYDASRKDDLTKVLAEKARVDAALEDAEFAWFQAEEQFENLLQEIDD